MLIYHNEERSIAEDVAAPLMAVGYDVLFAPLGLQTGSEVWKERIRHDLLDAGVVLFLLTEKSVMDEWVAWRTEEVFRRKNILFIPVSLDRPLPPQSTWVVPPRVGIYNWLSFSNKERFVFCLSSFLPLPAEGPNKRFDVFLSHNSSDKRVVREVAEALTLRGLSVWLDEWELVPGRPWQDALERMITASRAAAVLVGSDGIGPWQDREMRACLTEFVDRKLPVIPVLLPGAPTIPDLPMFLKQFTWVDLRKGLSVSAIDRLQWGITGIKPGATV
jgi:hypothetical protein